METLHVHTSKREQVLDLTEQIRDYLSRQKSPSGILLVYSPHTTGGITVNENADASVKRDMLAHLKALVPQDAGFEHSEGNSDAHIKGSLINFSQAFIVERGQVQLGTWQGIFFVEFDGPRSREVWLKFVAG